ncbi:unnamed protein product [Symbiodinium pilosum]|uniref:ISXO2-like transposase domain-containing protein n=1 Tax=Symbiodinium pilosum TaxID=2952 RepID=A0A812W9W1_SYMPI|nr:unnamed protein product [Symbiodinium pilosum]
MCEPAITQRSSAKQKEKFAQELARAQLPEHSIWFRGSRCCRLYSAVRFTVLPIRKTTWPLPQVAAFVQEYAEMPVPSLQALCRQVGVSRCTTSKTLFKWLLGQEAALGYARMQRCKLRGALEGDGTCLKLFRRAQANFHVALWGLVERPGSAQNPKCLIYLLPVKKTAANSVCPVESRADILSTGGLEQIERCLRSGRDTKSLLLTDGAQVYGRLAKEYGLSHRFVVHSKGQFSEMQSAGRHGRVRVNTGLIDQTWTDVKGFVPKCLTAGTKNSDEPSYNPHLFQYLYAWWLRKNTPEAKERLAMIGRALRGAA